MNKRTLPYSLVCIVLVFLGVSLPASSLAADPWHNLSGPMQPFGDVTDFEISPDNKYVVYTADQESDEVFNLYSVPLAGGSPVRLSSFSEMEEYIDFYGISTDSQYVVFIEDPDLYSVPIMGPASAAIKLNKTLPEDGAVWAYQISPDGKTVVYSADQDTDKTNELYAVPIAGPASAGVKLNGKVVAGGSLYTFHISPDSKSVVYRGDQDSYDIGELYSVPIDGSTTPIKLNKTLVEYGHVEGYDIDPTSQLVVYAAYQDDEDVKELYTVPLQGPASTGKKITPALPQGGVSGFDLSPDGKRVVFEAENPVSRMPELYSVPIDGPGAKAVKLSMPLGPDGFVFMYEISPDSSRVVYKVNQKAAVQYELYSVPIAGPASDGVKLNGPLADGRDVYRFEISSDSARVVYTAGQQGSKTTEVYSVPITGPASAGSKLNGPLANGGKAWYTEISPDASQVAYLADANTVGVDELFVVPIAGPSSATEQVSGPMAASGDGVWEVWFSPNSKNIVYTAEQESANNKELYATRAGTPPSEVREVYLPTVLSEK